MTYGHNRFGIAASFASEMHAEVHCAYAPLPRTQIFPRIFKSLRKPAAHVICVRHIDDRAWVRGPIFLNDCARFPYDDGGGEVRRGQWIRAGRSDRVRGCCIRCISGNQNTTMTRTKTICGGLSALALCLCLSANAMAETRIVLPALDVAGVSQAEWSKRWWQWASAFPREESPVSDRTGARCAAAQPA